MIEMIHFLFIICFLPTVYPSDIGLKCTDTSRHGKMIVAKATIGRSVTENCDCMDKAQKPVFDVECLNSTYHVSVICNGTKRPRDDTVAQSNRGVCWCEKVQDAKVCQWVFESNETSEQDANVYFKYCTILSTDLTNNLCSETRIYCTSLRCNGTRDETAGNGGEFGAVVGEVLAAVVIFIAVIVSLCLLHRKQYILLLQSVYVCFIKDEAGEHFYL